MFFLCLCLLLFLSSLVKAGAPEWASLPWSSLCFLLLSLFSFRQYQKNHRIDIKQAHLFIILAIIVWMLIQHFSGISLNKHSSKVSILICFGYLAFLSLLQFTCKTERDRALLFKTLITLGLVQSFYGWWQLYSDSPLILWMPKTHYLDKLTGTFVNANHSAAFLLICLVLLATQAIISLSQNNAQKPLQRFLKFLEFSLSPTSIILALLFISFLATKSIGAFSSLLVICFAVLIIICLRSAKVLTLSLLGFSFIIIISLSIIDFDVATKEWNLLAHTFERRFQIWDNSFELLKDHWLLGMGGGAFYSVFPQYRSLDVGHGAFYHAHNDYIEIWAELGIIGLSGFVAYIGLAMRRNLYAIRNAQEPYTLIFGYSSIFVTLGLAVHSIVDFPLHVHSYALIYLALISVNMNAGRQLKKQAKFQSVSI